MSGLSADSIAAALWPEPVAPTLDPDQWEAGADPGDPCREGGRGARAVAYSGSDLLKATFPPRPALLYRAGTPVLRAGNLVELVGQRGRGKSWVMLSLALLTACGGEVLGFSCADPLRVLYVDGEMESELVQQRLDLLAGPHGALDLRGDLSRLRYIAADWQADFLPRLDTPEGQAYIEYEVERADVVFLDNRSCLFDPNGEKDPEAWQPAQEYLLSLRRRGKAVVVAHHTNKQGGARGHSKAEDPLNAVWKLDPPADYQQAEGCRFVFSWEKSRSVFGAAIEPFEARFAEDEGWVMESKAPEVERRQTVHDLIFQALLTGAKSTSTLAAETGKTVDVIRKTVNRDLSRDKPTFVRLDGERVGLAT